MLKKFTSVVLIFVMSILLICPAFCIGIEDASKYVTKEECDKVLGELENEVDTMHAQYRKGVWQEVLKIYDSASTSPYSAGVGISIATHSGAANAQWTIKKEGEIIKKLPSASEGGIDTTRAQLMYMTPKYSKKSFVAKLIKSESPRRDLNTGERISTEGKCVVTREDTKAEITIEAGANGTQFSSYTTDGGSTWSAWHNDMHIIPLVHCKTAADVGQKQIWIEGFDTSIKEGSMFSVIFDNRQAASSLTLKVNDEAAKSIKFNNRVLDQNAWGKNTLVVFWYDGSSFQVLSSDKPIRAFIHHSTTADVGTSHSYGSNPEDFCFVECLGSQGWTYDKFFAYENLGSSPYWADLIDTWYGSGVNGGELNFLLTKTNFQLNRNETHNWSFKYYRLYGVF